MRFLLVEDNAELARATSDRLHLDGHVTDHAANLELADSYLETTDYDLILLDITLPDGEGTQFLKRHRDHKLDTPVIVITARSEISDRVGMLDLGADDYVTKPFDFSELEARCRAVLRRRIGSSSNERQYGKLKFDPLAATLTIGDRKSTLRNKELRLLEVLLSSPERIFSKSKLVDRLFSYEEDVSENAIEVYVGRLRKRLVGSGVEIETVRGVGYRASIK